MDKDTIISCVITFLLSVLATIIISKTMINEQEKKVFEMLDKVEIFEQQIDSLTNVIENKENLMFQVNVYETKLNDTTLIKKIKTK